MKRLRTLFAVVVVLIVLAFAQTVLADAAAPPDALVSDYAALAKQNFRHVLLPVDPLAGWESVSYNPAVLSQETLATLEPEHGGDSRYWELRYWCLQMNALSSHGSLGYDSGWAAETDETAAIELLLKARDCGTASPFALYSLAKLQRAQRRREIDAISADPSLDDAQRREALIYAMAADEEEFGRAQERINSTWPDEAWPKWWHADELFKLGEIEQACDWLEEGNAAAKCSYPACWPESLVREGLARNRRPFEPGLCGAILMAGRLRSLPLIMPWKNNMKEAELAFKLGGDLRACNSLQGFACRSAASAGADSSDCILALVFANAFSGVLLRNNAEELSQEQISALLDLQREVDTIQARLRSFGRDSELFNEQLLGAFYTDMYPSKRPESELEHCRERLREAYRIFPARRCRAYFDYAAYELQAVHQELAPRLALIGSFDYRDPGSPADWDTY